MQGWGYFVSGHRYTEYDEEALYGCHDYHDFGAFIAGSSPEGSAAIAYPVFTFIPRYSTGNCAILPLRFNLLGMTAASIYILKKIAVDWKYIAFVIIGGVLGQIVGTQWRSPIG